MSAQETTGTKAQLAELSLSDETIDLRYRTGTEIAGELTGEKSFTVFLSEDRDVVGSAAFLIDTDLDLVPRLQLQFGPQAYAALLSEENEDVVAFAIGLQARMPIGQQRGFAVAGHAFYAPDVLSFGSADNLTDLMLRAEMRLSPRLVGFIGYRWFRFDQTLGDRRTLQQEGFVGAQWRLD